MYTWQALYLSDKLFSHEVADFHSVTSYGNVDWKVGIYELHLVQESNANTSNHILDVGADGADACELLAVSEPKVYANLASLLHVCHSQVDVLELTADGTSLALYGHHACLDVNGD
jgi:hypothetical protein